MQVQVFTTVLNAYGCQHLTVVSEYCDINRVCNLQK